MKKETERFKFIGHALRGDGPFRPEVASDTYDRPYDVGATALIRYPRESEQKFAVRNQIAFYASPLLKASSRFVSHISEKPVSREIVNDLMNVMADDIDGKGNEVDVFWQGFMVNARARGSMLMLVDMPAEIGANAADQLMNRKAPYWTPIDPADVKDYQVNDAGKFDFVSFHGTYIMDDGTQEPCVWSFDTQSWTCKDQKDERLLAEGNHPLGECPVIAFTEYGDFPTFGAFAPIADLAKRLFNLESELDEILRSQTFSLLTLQVPEDSGTEERVGAAKAAGETIGTNNLMVHSGSTPAFIAPPDGPAKIYLERIAKLEERIDEIALQVATPNQRESGYAMQMRFQLINAELARFARRMEDFERRAWELSAKWLGQDNTPDISWPRNFNISDIEQELEILRNMADTIMPDEVLRQQKKRIVSMQFDGLEEDERESLLSAIENESSAA
jgi:hypothetical protein